MDGDVDGDVEVDSDYIPTDSCPSPVATQPCDDLSQGSRGVGIGLVKRTMDGRRDLNGLFLTLYLILKGLDPRLPRLCCMPLGS